MSPVTIREVRGEETLDVVFPLTEYAFRPTPIRPRADLAKSLPAYADKTVLVLFEDGRPMATAAAWHMTQNVRGRILPMGGVASVATDPQARRRGYARRVLTALLAAMRDAGQPVSTLYPFRVSFYGRLGWAPFPSRRIAQVGPASLAPLLRLDLPVRLHRRPLKDGFDDYTAFLDALQPSVHGLGLFPPALLARQREETTRWLLTVEADGQTTGLLTYAINEKDDKRLLRAEDFFFRDATARLALLQFVAQHIDNVDHAWLPLPMDEPADLWVDDHDLVTHTQYSIHHYYDPMGRILDLAGLAGIEVGPGAAVVRLIDQYAPWNDGTYALGGDDGRLAVARTDTEPDCTLTVQALSALVFTGHDPADFAHRGWGDPSLSAQATLRALFPRRAPLLHADF